MKISAIRGMNDILPEETSLWRYAETTIQQILTSYGYREIRLPLLEPTLLFDRSIGEVTDIVEKEMYTFLDRNGESLTLRPEGTASCVRACLEHGLLFNQAQRLWYQGPMFRYERPQKGRYRQFHQVGVEAFGFAAPELDAELLLLSAELWRQLGLAELVTLEINSIGSAAARGRYRADLVDYLSTRKSELDEDSRRRLDTNPLRILDSKVPQTQTLLDQAPVITDYLDHSSRDHFARLRELLDAAQLPYRINPRLVRGLDYYCDTVFEWVTSALGAQGTVCAGGRYDGLVEQLGGKPTPAVGMAMGLERLILLLGSRVQQPELRPHSDLYLIAASDAELVALMQLAERLRRALPQRVVVTHLEGGSLKSRMKRADKSGAEFALLLGEDELRDQMVSLKPLRSEAPQQRFSEAALIDHLRQHFAVTL